MIASLLSAGVSVSLAQAPAPDPASRLPAQSALPSQALPPGRVPAPGTSPIGPVKIGIYLFSVQELDFSKFTFHPTFEVWFRWRGDAFDPLANLHVVGARSMTVTREDRRKLGNGENYAVARVDAVINETFDTSAFPFDRHRLEIAIESPFEEDYLVYEMDRDASMLDPDAFSPVWRLSGFRLREYRKAYPTSFGLTERTDARYSTLVAEVVAERNSWRAAVDYFIGFIVCVLLCLLGLFRAAEHAPGAYDARDVGDVCRRRQQVRRQFAHRDDFTARLVNVAVISSFAILLIYIVVSIRCDRLIRDDEPARAARLNRNVGIGSAVAYGLLMAFYFWRA